MAISDEAFNQAQEYEIKHTIKYKWRDEWKKLYREYLSTFFEISDSFPESVVVDVGCGPVGIISVIKAREKVGIDPLIDEYKKIFDMEPDVRYINAKGEDIPLQDGYADFVFCVNTLNHVQNPEKVLSEIARILKPGGKLYFDVHNNPISVGHPHAFTQESVQVLLKRHFKVERTIEQDEMKSISYDIYCADCGHKLRLRDQTCPVCKKDRKRIEGPRIYTVGQPNFYKSKPTRWGLICCHIESEGER